MVSPSLPFPLSLPSPFPFPLSFQINQWEGRSDPVRGEFPDSPPYKYHPDCRPERHVLRRKRECYCCHGNVTRAERSRNRTMTRRGMQLLRSVESSHMRPLIISALTVNPVRHPSSLSQSLSSTSSGHVPETRRVGCMGVWRRR